MNNQLDNNISIESDFFQELEEEIGIKTTGKPAIFRNFPQNSGIYPSKPLHDSRK